MTDPSRATHADHSELVLAVAKAIENADIGRSIELTRLVDGIHEYTLTYHDGTPPILFESMEEASAHVRDRAWNAKACAAIDAMTAYHLANPPPAEADRIVRLEEEIERLRTAADLVAPVLVYSVGPESVAWHPTMPSAVEAFLSAFEIDTKEKRLARFRGSVVPSEKGRRVTVREVAAKLLSVPENVQYELVDLLGLREATDDEDARTPDHEIGMRAVRRASELGRLERLDAALTQRTKT